MEATAIIEFDRRNHLYTATSEELEPYEIESKGDTPYVAVEDFILGIQDIIELYEMYGQVDGLPDIKIFTIDGKRIANTNISNLKKGLYVVITNGTAHKILVK